MPFLSWVPVSTAPSGPAGGALSGTYPNPGIAVPVDLQAASGSPVFGASVTGDTFNRIEMRSTSLAWGTGAVAPDTILSRIAGPVLQSSQNFKVLGNVDVGTNGAGLQVAEGANAKQGTSTLAAGTVTVANTSVTANSRIMITGQSLGTVTVFSAYGVSARTAGTSFTILASQATDTSVVAWEIFEPG